MSSVVSHHIRDSGQDHWQTASHGWTTRRPHLRDVLGRLPMLWKPCKSPLNKKRKSTKLEVYLNILGKRIRFQVIFIVSICLHVNHLRFKYAHWHQLRKYQKFHLHRSHKKSHTPTWADCRKVNHVQPSLVLQAPQDSQWFPWSFCRSHGLPNTTPESLGHNGPLPLVLGNARNRCHLDVPTWDQRWIERSAQEIEGKQIKFQFPPRSALRYYHLTAINLNIFWSCQRIFSYVFVLTLWNQPLPPLSPKSEATAAWSERQYLSAAPRLHISF